MSQKCLSAPPGPRAVHRRRPRAAKLERRIQPGRSWYFDLVGRARLLDRRRARRAPTTTPRPINLVYALHEALRIVPRGVAADAWERHRRAHDALRDALAVLGLRAPGARRRGAAHRCSRCASRRASTRPAVRGALLRDHGIEIPAASAPLAGRAVADRRHGRGRAARAAGAARHGARRPARRRPGRAAARALDGRMARRERDRPDPASVRRPARRLLPRRPARPAGPRPLDDARRAAAARAAARDPRARRVAAAARRAARRDARLLPPRPRPPARHFSAVRLRGGQARSTRPLAHPGARRTRARSPAIDPARLARAARGARRRCASRRCKQALVLDALADARPARSRRACSSRDFERLRRARAVPRPARPRSRPGASCARSRPRSSTRLATAPTSCASRPPGTDMTLDVKGRTWVNSDGKRNMPSRRGLHRPARGVAPTGVVRFGVPSSPAGRRRRGRRAASSATARSSARRAERGEDYLAARAGDRRRAPGGSARSASARTSASTAPIGAILFDEKIGGTVHLALGRSYPETGGKNESALHWDLICDLRAGRHGSRPTATSSSRTGASSSAELVATTRGGAGRQHRPRGRAPCEPEALDLALVGEHHHVADPHAHPVAFGHDAVQRPGDRPGAVRALRRERQLPGMGDDGLVLARQAGQDVGAREPGDERVGRVLQELRQACRAGAARRRRSRRSGGRAPSRRACRA